MDGTQVRFGQIKGVIGTNLVPGDNIVPLMAQWYSGPVISAGDMALHRGRVRRQRRLQRAPRLFRRNAGQFDHGWRADWQNDALQAANWMNGQFVDVMLGWQSFSSLATKSGWTISP